MTAAMPHRTHDQINRARTFRTGQTSAEARLWSRLRAGRLNGYKFVRQEPIGTYFADFACRSSRLIVEVDGATHSTPGELHHDAVRSRALESFGYTIRRFTNAEIFENLEGVLETILARLERREVL